MSPSERSFKLLETLANNYALDFDERLEIQNILMEESQRIARDSDSPLSPLRTATTKELSDELFKRVKGAVLVATFLDNKNTTRTAVMCSSPDLIASLGLAQYAINALNHATVRTMEQGHGMYEGPPT